MRILWDEPKRQTTLATRNLDFADLSPEFFDTAIVRQVRQGRSQAIGQHLGFLVAVVFLPLGTEAVSVVSLRRASRKERNIYETEAPSPD